jgi:hypothetical protein
MLLQCNNQVEFVEKRARKLDKPQIISQLPVKI